MCEQRIAYFSLKLARPGTPAELAVDRMRLKEEDDRLEADENTLVQGGGGLDRAATYSPELRALYFDAPSHLDKELRDYVAIAPKLPAAPPGNLIFNNSDVLRLQEKNHNIMVQMLNKS